MQCSKNSVESGKNYADLTAVKFSEVLNQSLAVKSLASPPITDQ